MSDLIPRLQAALGDRYLVERELGRGGMATVYLAHDARHARHVAIKVLNPDLAAHVGADRFLREIQIAAKLSHPHILSLHESGAADGLLYYVMPYVEGESLRDRIRRETQLPLEDAIGIACEVADALSHAHMYGVVHRDIKPENILLQGGHALLADFGIARAVDEGTSKLTATGTAVGTAAYMSPEQFMGTAVDGRSDQYSLAATLYEMLIGETPFTGPTAQAIMARAALEDVPSLQVVRGSIPDDVEDAILRALEKTQADRFPTMAQFRDALAMAATGSATMRRATMRATMRGTRSVTRIVERQRRRQRAVAIAAGVLLATAGGGLGWKLVLKPTTGSAATNKNNVAVMYFDVADTADEQARALADGVTESLIDQLRQVSGFSVVSRNGVLPFLGREVRDDSVAASLQVGTLVRGLISREKDKYRVSFRVLDANGNRMQGGDVLLPRDSALALYGSAGSKLTELLRQWIGSEVRLGETRAATSSVEAWTLYQRAERTRKDAAAARAAARGPEAVRLAGAADSLLALSATADGHWLAPLVLRARVLYERATAERGPAARPWLDSALAIAERAAARDSGDADALTVRGDVRYERYRRYFADDRQQGPAELARARADLERAIAIDPNHAGALTTLSSLYYRTYEVADANIMALRAYKADAYLEKADDIVHRLFLTSHDLGSWGEASKYCDEGRRRFPEESRFQECRLVLLGIGRATPELGAPARIAEAWARRDSIVALTPAAMRDVVGRQQLIWVASAIAAAERPDSARHVLARVRADAELDAETAAEFKAWEALIHLRLNDKDEAISLLTQYFTVFPDHREGFARQTNWWWKDLENDPRFRRLVGAR
ncbi:MAG: protein kinase domain-containing protein [Gemmatimonadaceae bacterium]